MSRPTVLVTGANRGIGLEFSRQYLADGWCVIATLRDPANAGDLDALDGPGELVIEPLDVTDHDQIDGLAARHAGQPIDVLLNNAGIIGPVPIPEHIEQQHFGSMDYLLWDRVLWTNTFAPLKMAEAFVEHVAASDQKKIVALSSTVGSLVERDTAAFAYATSKTALNKAMRLLASVLKERGISVGIFCPGYVQTRMDFGTAEVKPEDSVKGLRGLIADLELADSGTFQRYNGETVAW
ncbi:MAG: SDR family oxidoreductase [Chromatiales bacterium]|nr:MAG: SDR family oxidoreductase [Chromatiales bacterium]